MASKKSGFLKISHGRRARDDYTYKTDCTADVEWFTFIVVRRPEISTWTMASRAILLVPPLIKYSSGPLLGPALLQSAARLAGHECSVVDLNAHYLQPRVSKRGKHGSFVGDHDKPTGSQSLGTIERNFMKKHILPGLLDSDEDVDLNRKAHFGFLSHDQVQTAALRMMSSSFGSWASEILQAEHVGADPQVVGVSLLHAGQVIPAVAISKIAKTIWPNAITVWGGPHISGLGRKAIETDLMERSFAADIFVVGHAEQTFVQILDKAASTGWTKPDVSMVLSGQRGRISVAPTFEKLDLYDSPLTLPAQSALGCSYGRCAYCTYPKIEPKPEKLNLLNAVGSVADMAVSMNASVSIKDSLATCTRLLEIGACIDNRVPWSACTKLSKRLDLSCLDRLNRNGLATLEVGLESLLEETQRRISKVQPPMMFEQFVSDVAKVDNLTLVVNYMIGFPWEDPVEAMAKLNEAKAILDKHLGDDRACIELNEFELERLAPMAQFPKLFGIDKVQAWPWASVMEYTVATDESMM